MDDVRGQYESLSERLARESEMGSISKDSNKSKSSKSRKVRWAETAAIASTMDANNAAASSDDPDYVSRSPMDILSDLFTKKYTLPVFLLMASVIFLMVHLAGGPNDDSFQRYSSTQQGGEGATVGNRGPSKYGGSNRQKNVGGGDGFGDIVFSLVPTSPEDSTLVPTIEVIHHITPKISPTSAGTPSAVTGNEPGWIVVPTKTGVFLTSDANGDNGDGTRDDGSPTTLKWNFGAGVPTPDPAQLAQEGGRYGYPDRGSPTSLKWNYGKGSPTPDPALLGPDNGSPTTLTWNYPPGVATPNPALLVEVAPPDDNGSPTTLKWGGLGAPPKPRPSPQVVTPPEIGDLSPVDPDAGSPTTLKWRFPPGQPTPDPALLKGMPDQLVWGYPPGVPTPDPILLQGGVDQSDTLEWGYPPGVPTPDPALLTTSGEKAELGWGYPPGEPTPDPAYLNGVPLATESPTMRNVETGLVMPTPKPTPRPTQRPSPDSTPLITAAPLVQITASPLVTLKVVDITPPRPRPTPKPTPPTPKPTPEPTEEVSPPSPKEPEEDPVEVPTPSPVIPPAPVDENGNEIEIAPPEPTPRPPRPPRGPKKPTRPVNPNRVPAPLVNTQPYNGPGGITLKGQGTNPDWVFHNGPNGFDMHHPGVVGQNPNYPGVIPNYPGVIPQQPEIPGQPEIPPGQVPQYPGFYPANGGVVITQQQSCGCSCCSCCPCGGGGGMMGGMMLPQGVNPQMIQGGAQGMLPMGGAQGMLPMHIPLAGSQTLAADDPLKVDQTPTADDPLKVDPAANVKTAEIYPSTLAPTVTPGCPWDCIIDENVPSMGRSKEDDALYEIFYTNPLNCCGMIVEIGAEGGKDNSPSYFFEKGMNWTSILTEADPLAYAEIATNRAGDKVKAINGAYCENGPFLYFDDNSRKFKSDIEDISTSEPMDQNLGTSGTMVNCIQLDTVLAGVDHVNVMIIRVKGDPWAVIRTMNWSVRVDIWVILMEERDGLRHDTIRAALSLHDYVPAAWDIKLWCIDPANCMANEVWLQKDFNPIHQPMLGRGLRGAHGNHHFI